MQQLTAEHVSYSNAKTLLDSCDYEIIHARMDDTFTSVVHIVVDDHHADAMREKLWEINGGASCEVFPITEDELEEYL